MGLTSKPEWKIIQISSWKQFVDVIERLDCREEKGSDWYFRGQALDSWPLKPTLNRLLGTKVTNPQKACGIEHGALRRFTAKFHLHFAPDGVIRSSWSPIAWWMIMQHHGCPTRMLDWTESPYVALYFAVMSEISDDGAVWCFPSTRMNADLTLKGQSSALLDDELFGWDTNVRAVVPILCAQESLRSATQSGVFTVCTQILDDHETIIADACCGHSDCYKLVIPSELKHDFLSRLRQMNITALSLFPGADGLGRSISEHVMLRVWSGN